MLADEVIPIGCFGRLGDEQQQAAGDADQPAGVTGGSIPAERRGPGCDVSLETGEVRTEGTGRVRRPIHVRS